MTSSELRHAGARAFPKTACRLILSIVLTFSGIFVPARFASCVERRCILIRPTPGGVYQLYVPATAERLNLPGTEKMNHAVVGDVDGDGREDDIVYNNALTGGLGYYVIPGDGTYHSENDHVIPGVPADSVPLTVLRTSVSGSPGIVIFQSQSAGTSGALLPTGVGLTDLGWMQRAYCADLRRQGYSGDLLWTNGSSLFWRESVTGTDHPSPLTGAVPLGAGSIISNQLERVAILYLTSGVVCAADSNWNYTTIDGLSWPWCTNLRSNCYGDIDGSGTAEMLFVKSSSDPLQCYMPPASGGPYNPAGLSTDPSLLCGWNLHGVVLVDVLDSPVVAVERIADARGLPDGTVVQLTAKQRTNLVVELDANHLSVTTGYYLEESDRSSGIRVMGATAASEGQSVAVEGTLSTVNGERVIISSGESTPQSGQAIKPLGATIKSLYNGLAMTGLLVRLSGGIVSPDVDSGVFSLNDGSGQTLKVYCPDFNQTSGFCTVTGCVGSELSGGTNVPVLRVESAAKGMGASPPPAGDNYFVWTQSSTKKVAKTDSAQSLQTAAISAARNEHEAFQIVLRGDQVQINSVTLTKHDLTGASGTIPASNINIYLPYYINLPYYSRDVADPLPPYSSPFNLQPGQTQPVWVDVYVPKTAAAGDYSGSIAITSSNGKTTQVPVTLHVYNFTLPDESKLATQFDFDSYYMAPKEGVTYGSAASKALWRQYYEFLLQRGISTAAIPVDNFISSESLPYLQDVRLTSFRIPYDPNASSQAAYFNHIKSAGAWSKGFCDVADEVYTQDDYNFYKTKASYYHSVDPTAQCLATYYAAAPTWAAPNHITDLLAGYVNIWCPISGDAFEADRLAVRRAAGDKVWTYVCTNPDGVTPNFFLQDPAISHRIIAWQCYLHQAVGWLYWHSNFWRDVTDPWTDACTGKGIDPRLYGEGSLLYPGKVHTGTAGPVSSVRLEVFRDSLEDYKYLWLLEQKIGRSQVLPYVQQLATDWHSYTSNITTLASVRASIASRIEN